MDFEFQNGTGNVDQRSPFVQVSNNAQRFGTPFGSKKSTEQAMTLEWQHTDRVVDAGPLAAFESPSKTPGRSQQTSPSKPLPPPPAWNTLFNTPRKPKPDIDDSSAGETPKNDSDATPDTLGLRSALSRFDAQSAPALPTSVTKERGSPSKERPGPRREVSFSQSVLYKVKKICSPGRGEIFRREHNPDGIEKSVAKRRKRQVDRRVARNRRHSMSESEADSDYHPPRSPRKTSGQNTAADQAASDKPHWISSFFSFIASQPMLPHILSWYAQLAFNTFILLFLGYLIYNVWAAVQGDIERNASLEAAKLMAEAAACLREWNDNSCDPPPPAVRPPRLDAMCNNWANCMNQDVTRIARASVSAATFASIYNAFVEQMSWKAIAVTVILLVGTFSIGNLAFGLFRNRAADYQQYPPQWQQQPPPPTPQRNFSGQDGGFYMGTPWQQQPVLEPQPSGGFGQIEGRSSPVRRIAYN